MATRLVVLALCCALAIAGGDAPKNFTAGLGDSNDDTVDVKLTWEKVTCDLWKHATYTVTYTQNGTDKKDGGSTQGFDKTIPMLEYWTMYNFTLSTECFTKQDDAYTFILTGPGNPHPVVSVTASPNSTAAEVVWTESTKMPMMPDTYNVTYCLKGTTHCNSTFVARNVNNPTLRTVIGDLDPTTSYTVNVSAVIVYQGKNYTGMAVNTDFNTTEFVSPQPENFNVVFSSGKADHNATITWELNTKLHLFQYNISLVDADNNKTIATATTNKTAIDFSKLSFYSNLTVGVLPIVTYHNKQYSGHFTNFTFGVPGGDIPAPSNFTSVPLSNTSVLVAWDSSNLTVHYAYSLTICLDKNCTSEDLAWTNRTLINLKPNSTYTVSLYTWSYVHKIRTNGTALNTTFVTLAKDYPAPSGIVATQMKSGVDTVAYNLTWSFDDSHPNVTFYLAGCFTMNKCFFNHTTKKSILVDVEYFASYWVYVDAIYSLPHNVTVKRTSAEANFTTIGTNPGPVDSPFVRNITSNSARLLWRAPKKAHSVPVSEYLISDEKNNLINKTSDTSFFVSGLKTYTNRTFIVAAYINYMNHTYNGTATAINFTTDVGTPGPVTNMTFMQQRDSTFILSWAKPAITNGPISFYNVTVMDSNKTVIDKTTDYANEYYTVELPTVNGANYTAQVVPVNVNYRREFLYGNATQRNATFRDIGAPLNATLLKRTGSQLFLEITPPAGMANDSLNYAVEVMNTSEITPFIGNRGVVEGLPFNTTLVLTVRVCFEDEYCGLALEFNATTNYGSPDKVTGLTGTVLNLTNPIFTWKAPIHANGPLDGYRVTIQDITEPGDLPTVEYLPANQTTYNKTRTEEYETYNFTVQAFNKDRDNATNFFLGEVAVISMTTSGKRPPKPVNVKQDEMGSDNATLEWTAPPPSEFNVTFYHVVAPLKTDVFTNKTSIQIEGLPIFKNTSVLISGCTSNNKTACGEPRNFTVETDAFNPSEPTGLNFTDVTTAGMLLHWGPPKEKNGLLAGYQLCFYEMANETCKWIEIPSDSHVYNITGLKKNTNYTVELLVYNTNSKGTQLPSKPAYGSHLTAGAPSSAGFPVWAIILIVALVAAAVAGAAVVYYKKRQANNHNDEDVLVRA